MNKKIIKKISAGGVLYCNDKYLTIKWMSQGTIELPKGTIETNETPEQACVREMLEETGYNVRVICSLSENTFVFDWKDGNTYQKTVHYFLMERVDNLDPTPNREDNEDFENSWLNYEDAVILLTYDDMKEAVKKAHDILNKTKLKN